MDKAFEIYIAATPEQLWLLIGESLITPMSLRFARIGAGQA
jgi:hypothetical protein